MKLILFLTVALAFPAWSQSADSTAAPAIPPKSNFRSSFMLEPGYAYAYTWLPAIRSFFRDNQVKQDGSSDRLFVAGLGYRRQRFKVMVHSFLGIDQSILPPNKAAGASLVAQRHNRSGIDLLLGYDVANLRNQRVFINAGIGSIRYEYSLFRPTNQPVAFQQILQYAPPSSVPSLYLTTGFWDVNVEVTNREKRRGSFQWVTRLGFRRSFQADAWQSDAYQLVDAPLDRISQLYFQVSFYISQNRMARRK